MGWSKVRELVSAGRRAKATVDQAGRDAHEVIDGPAEGTTGDSPRVGNLRGGPGRVRRPFKQSRSLRLATFITAIGAVMWVFAAATGTPTGDRAPADAAGIPSLAPGDPATPKRTTWGEEGVASGFRSPAAPASVSSGEDGRRLIDKTAPWTFRMGLSFMVGFFVAWAVRKFVKLTILIGGAIGLVVLVLKQTGVVSLDWSAVEQHVSDGVVVAQREASRYREMLLALAPSGAAGVVGAFFGFRHD